ncbi:hypothetical protein FGE12_14380 [Aggregicoccus sp. 17bor-14]|uniref:hypothetical protein n=1 Tax=Myxococcaceae TaxID=31 RepID=UPI00129CE8FD|nr:MULTISPECIES: hypothetical protein [Myxococcaceae]MBF5043580.1 hypothetical protein [Simulacricoccus sp. 17bor-14]MRI89339.1 hypothetical protein [Aggregicoccus sp. 17bor-14]
MSQWAAARRSYVLRSGSALALALGLLGFAAPAWAQRPSVPAPYSEWQDAQEREKDAQPREFSLINYFFTRATLTNQLGDPSGLKGVSLGPIGQVGGSSVRVESGKTNAYIEQRWIPVIEYTPWFVDGLAAFRAQMEIDYLWGRSANTVQQNEGGGFNADQINIQTKNVNVAFYPFRDPTKLTLLIGTQSVYDSYQDPTRTPLNDITRTGYKLTFLGSDATGLSVFSSYKGHAKLSFLPLGSAQSDKAARDDPRLKYVYLISADYVYPLAPNTNVGASFWRLRDDTKGDAYAYEGLVRSGPSSTGLGGFTGVPRFNIERPNGTVYWAGAHFNHNIDFRMGRFGASGFAMYNFGRFTSQNPDTTFNKHVDISGLSADAEFLYRYGHGANDIVRLEGLFSTGDSDLNDDKYKGAFTLNEYGLPGAVWFNHGMLLLFPFTSTVNNYTGAVTDISNQGYGLRTLLASASHDFIPNKLNLKLGVGTAMSGVNPVALADATSARGKYIGTEINAELRYTIRYLMTVGLHGGYMFKGDFYDGMPRVSANPYALFTTFTWYAF